MEGFSSFNVDTVYIVYEVRQENFNKPIIVKKLATANKCKKLLRNIQKKSSVFKRVGFLDKGIIYCTSGYNYSVEFVNNCEKESSTGDINVINDLFDNLI
jgi:hypothetical protein